MKQVVLYGREGCCLCEEAREQLDRLGARHPGVFVLQERDIDLVMFQNNKVSSYYVNGAKGWDLTVSRRDRPEQTRLHEASPTRG